MARKSFAVTRMVVVGMALLLGACAGQSAVSTTPPPGYVAEPAARLRGVDWSQATTVPVELSSFAFHPNVLHFQRGHAYRLELTNTAVLDHTFVSAGFFQSIAVRSLSTDQGVLDMPFVEKIVVPAGKTRHLLFVAVQDGSWDVVCTVPTHEALGMRGTIDIKG